MLHSSSIVYLQAKTTRFPKGLWVLKKYSAVLFISNPYHLLYELRIQALATRNQYVLKLLHQYASLFIPFKVILTVSGQMLIFFINVMPFRFSVTLRGSNGSDKDIMSACVFVALVSQQDYWAQVATISTCFSCFTKRFIFLNTVSLGFSQGATKVHDFQAR